MISRTRTPIRAGRSRRPSFSGNLFSGQQDEDVLEVRRAALALVAVGVQDADARAGAAGAVARGVGLLLHLQELRGRPVDLDRLGARVLEDEVTRRARGDGL